MGKDIIYAGVWKKNDERMVYNLVYTDGGSGRTYVKRFNVLAITRDKEYDLTKKAVKGTKVHYISANPNGEAETITIKLTSGSKARKKVFDFDFSELEIKGRGAGGNIVTKYPVRKVEFKSEGVSTLTGVDIWYDEVTGRLNREERGRHVGNFNGDDKLVVLYKTGEYEVTSYELTNRYEADKVLDLYKLSDSLVISAVHIDGESKQYFVKRFNIETNTTDKRFSFINESKGSSLVIASLSASPVIEVTLVKGKSKEKEVVQTKLDELIDVKGWKATGNKLSQHTVKKVVLLEDKSASMGQNKAPKPTDSSSEVKEEVANEKEEAQPELFEESQGEEKQPEKKKKSAPAKKSSAKGPKSGNKRDGGYDIGTTIELDF